jgi:3-oxoacyl-[acyl-carrier protein] reductase
MAAIVTGGSRGIGLGVAKRLVQHGYFVGVMARSESGLQEALAELRAVQCDAPEPVAIRCDVSDGSSVQSAVDTFMGHCRTVQGGSDVPSLPLNCVVACAGIAGDHLLVRSGFSQRAADTVATCLTGSLHLLHATSKHLVRSRHGSVVLLGSVAAKSPRVGQVAYAASKAGLEGAARAAAVELGRFRVRVNVVQPGFVRTAMTEASECARAGFSGPTGCNAGVGLDREVLEAIERASPLGRLVSVRDVVDAVDFLLSPHPLVSESAAPRVSAAAITGTTLTVDAGLTCALRV